MGSVFLILRREQGKCWTVCFCCFDSNEVSNGKLSAAWRDQRPRDTVETQHTQHTHTHTLHYMHTYSPYTYKHTHLVTPGQLPPTANYCSAHMVVALKPLDHVWIDLWCGCWSTNRHAEILKKMLTQGVMMVQQNKQLQKCFILFYSLHLNNSVLKAPKTSNTRIIMTLILS